MSIRKRLKISQRLQKETTVGPSIHHRPLDLLCFTSQCPDRVVHPFWPPVPTWRHYRLVSATLLHQQVLLGQQPHAERTYFTKRNRKYVTRWNIENYEIARGQGSHIQHNLDAEEAFLYIKLFMNAVIFTSHHYLYFCLSVLSTNYRKHVELFKKKIALHITTR